MPRGGAVISDSERDSDAHGRSGSYSPQQRTVLVLSGTGAHGAYHAGVLKALHEAGVKIDLLAGHGVGAGGAALAAIDGAARTWEPTGIWQDSAASRLYGWKPSLRLLGSLAAALAAAVVIGLLLAALDLISLRVLVVVEIVVIAAIAATAQRLIVNSLPLGRRAEGGWWWRAAGAPVDATPARDLFLGAIWESIRGAAPGERPSRAALGRRFSEGLAENLGQPGFAELLVIATDLDSRRDVVAALLREPYRAAFFGLDPRRERRTEVLDLSGIARDHALDVVAGALTPPVICDPAFVTFAADSYWRGETHRLCDRPGALLRLLEEAALAGATQAIVVSAVATAPAPHRLRVPRIDPRSRLGEVQAAAEAAALRDALTIARLRFASVYVVVPAHNPVGPFDLAGAYDDASDRRQDLRELMERGYEDAYRQFIEPVVGASGEQLARASDHVEAGSRTRGGVEAGLRARAEVEAGLQARDGT